MVFLYEDMPAENLKRGRRLIHIDNGITSELGGLPKNDGVTRCWTPTGGVKMYPQSGKESEKTFSVTGKKRGDDKTFFDTDPTRVDRGDYTVVDWERAGKKRLEVAQRQERPVGLHHTPRKQPEIAPFATTTHECPIPFHRQRRYVEVPGSARNEALQEAKFVPKRSRTPPASVKLRCENEGFTVIYSTNTAEKQRQVAGGVKMIPFEHHGKGVTTTADKIAEQRRNEEEKKDANFIAHRQYLRAVEERMVANQLIRPHGKKVGQFHPADREGGPNAMELPLPRHYVVGKSCSRTPRGERPAWQR